MSATILWFRRDLRINDNPALHWACCNEGPIIPIYIAETGNGGDSDTGSASRWWLYNSLNSLAKDLSSYHLDLLLFSGDSAQILAKLVNDVKATAIVFNEVYEPAFINQDKKILIKLANKIHIQKFSGNLFRKPGTLLNNQEKPYRVFTPFWKNLRKYLEIENRVAIDNKLTVNSESQTKLSVKGKPIDELKLLDKHQWHKKLHQYWQPGEKAAHAKLEYFLNGIIDDYEINRDYPNKLATSQLSPHLHFGEITHVQIYQELVPLLNQPNDHHVNKSLERFLIELGWREFAHHVLWHFPYTVKKPMYEKFDRFWLGPTNHAHLRAWQSGTTGVPLVDAGMRQLWNTGWMHNRVRMIVASYLTKNLGIHWRHGAEWFWDTLVDADLANNTLGWQWVAGCGVDAAPYYRIFNPKTQAKKFDSNNCYIDKWLPEFSNGKYVEPIVDLKHSRDQALSRYNNL